MCRPVLLKSVEDANAGTFSDPAERLVINPSVCEGCGDCGVQSNCVSILPLETPLGRKRQIDQSSCNKDYSCVSGFCPSFATVSGGQLRKLKAHSLEVPKLPLPALPEIDGTHNIIITGVGGHWGCDNRSFVGNGGPFRW